ncbi:MAG TPA: hypothetical protein VN175_13180 [Rhizomicrobium sp.]|nr:hypothetical protein [Rhizomicrobium sp.]
MYLLAMKSFYAKLGRGKIVAIINRDMPAEARAMLQRHFPGIVLSILEDIDVGTCQRGGTWERLLYILDLADREYVIQLDSDTLTFGADVGEVVRCAEKNLAFTLSSRGQPIRSMAETADEARQLKSDYIGLVAERLFDSYPGADTRKYVRGSSGFAGFAKGAFPREQIEEFHRIMEGMLGARWKEWGTEQCGSNFAVANSPGAVVLPYPKYAHYFGADTPSSGAFLHFIGTHRYRDDYFARRGQAEIARLSAGA